MRCSIAQVLTLVLFVMLSGFGHADTIHVPADQATIQAAIDTASSGDTILVAAGTFLENIDFLGKAVNVRSESGASTTVIDGSAPLDPIYTSVVTFRSGEGLDSVLDGFTLMRGTGYREDLGLYFTDYGGGIFCDSASPTIIHCIIRENVVDNGGGILCQNGAAPLIEDNLITDNSGGGGGIGCISGSSPTIRGNTIVSNYGYSAGGGILCRDSSSPLIENNDISGNSALWFAGGIQCWGYCSPTIIGNTIDFNRVESGSGGGIFCHDHSSPIVDRCVVRFNWVQFGASGLTSGGDCSPRISNCQFTNNTAWLSDGGALGFGSGSPIITNCTVAKNWASYQGGAIYCGSDVNLTIVNSIFWGNEASDLGKEIYIGYEVDSPSHVTIDHSDLEGGLSSVHVAVGSTLDWGTGMLDADPLFVDAANYDFHLTYTSPCRDIGDNGVVTDLLDFEGDPRFAWAGTVDLGADEFYTHLYYTGDATPGSDIQGKLIGLPGTWPVGLFFSSSVRETPWYHQWGEFWLEEPWFVVPLIPIPANGVLVMPLTLPLDTPAPYDIPMQGLVGLNSDSLTNLSALEVR